MFEIFGVAGYIIAVFAALAVILWGLRLIGAIGDLIGGHPLYVFVGGMILFVCYRLVADGVLPWWRIALIPGTVFAAYCVFVAVRGLLRRYSHLPFIRLHWPSFYERRLRMEEEAARQQRLWR